jgi:hypothetical protein
MEDTKELQWIKVKEHSAIYSSITMTEYVDTSGKFCKQVWSDGYEEVFEIG